MHTYTAHITWHNDEYHISGCLSESDAYDVAGLLLGALARFRPGQQGELLDVTHQPTTVGTQQM